jgi:hypothetical protein
MKAKVYLCSLGIFMNALNGFIDLRSCSIGVQVRSVIANLIKTVVVVRQDEPSVMETLTAGVVVDFDPVDGMTEIVCDGKVYVVMVKDLLEAAHPLAWGGRYGSVSAGRDYSRPRSSPCF